jgi:hypothetical protein
MELVPVDVPAVAPHLPEEGNAEDSDIHSRMLHSVNTHGEGEPHVSHHVDEHVSEVEQIESHSVNALDNHMEPVALHSGNAADVEMETAVSHGVDAHSDTYVYMEPVESHSGNAPDVDMENGAAALSEGDVPTIHDLNFDFDFTITADDFNFTITDHDIDLLHDDELFGSWSSAPVYDYATPPDVDTFTAPAGDQVNEEAFTFANDDIPIFIEDFPSVPAHFTPDDPMDGGLEDASADDAAPIEFPAFEWDDSMIQDIEAHGYFDDATIHEAATTEQAPEVPDVEHGMDVDYHNHEDKDDDHDMDELFGPDPSTEVTVSTAVPASPTVPSITSHAVGSVALQDSTMDEDRLGLVGAPAPAAVSAVVPASLVVRYAVDSAPGGAAMASPAMSPPPTIPGTPMRPVLEPTRVSVKLPPAVYRPRPAQAPIAFIMTASPAAPKLDKRFIIDNTPSRPTCNILSLQPGYRPPRKLNVEPRQKEAYVEEFEDNDGFRQKVRWDLRGFPTLDVDMLRHTEQLMLNAAEDASRDWPSRQAGIEEQSVKDEEARKARVNAAFEAKKKRDLEAYKKRMARKKENPIPSMFGKSLLSGVYFFPALNSFDLTLCFPLFHPNCTHS